jgi:hypothetical protein
MSPNGLDRVMQLLNQTGDYREKPRAHQIVLEGIININQWQLPDLFILYSAAEESKI